jgi:hypothetical protein
MNESDLKNIILLSIIALGIFATPQKVQAAKLVQYELQNVPKSFSKKQFTTLLTQSNIAQNMNVKSIVQSLVKIKDAYYFKATQQQLQLINKYNNGRMKYKVGIVKSGGGSDI